MMALVMASLPDFSTDFALQPEFSNDNIQVISCWCGNKGSNSDYVDYWFPAKRLATTNINLNDRGNHSHLDSVREEYGRIYFSGWHASNLAYGKQYHYLILLDRTTGTEVGREKVENHYRPDVERVHHDVYNSAYSGFNDSINVSYRQAGHQLQLVSRWTNDPAGNGDGTDSWFAVIDPSRDEGFLDSCTHPANTVTVSGWNATNASLVQPYHILILLDSTTNREVKRIRVYNTARNDVARVYPAIWTANNSGFTGSFSNVNLQAGHHYSLISRYLANPLANTYIRLRSLACSPYQATIKK